MLCAYTGLHHTVHIIIEAQTSVLPSIEDGRETFSLDDMGE